MIIIAVIIFKSYFHCVQEIHQQYIIKICLSGFILSINTTVKDNITIMGVKDVMV